MSNSWFRLYNELLNDPKVQGLPSDAFKVYINLLCVASANDPRGVLPATPDLAFLLRFTEKKLEKFLKFLKNSKLLDENDGNFIVHGWDKRQFESDNISLRTQRHREKMRAIKNVAGNVPKNVPGTDLERPQRTDTETDTEKERPREYICPELKKKSASGPSFMSIPLTPKDGVYPIMGEQIEQWSADYPGIDVKRELIKLKNWNQANPAHRKTKRGVLRHIVGWLSRAQDSACRPRGRTQGAKVDEQGRDYIA